MLEGVNRASYDISKGEWEKIILQIPELAGYAVGYPVAQPRRTIKAFIDLAQGNTDDFLSLIWGTWAREQSAKNSQKIEPFRIPSESDTSTGRQPSWAR